MNINNRDYKIEDLEKLLDNINEEAFIKDEFGICEVYLQNGLLYVSLCLFISCLWSHF